MFNAGDSVFKNFLDITPDDVQNTLNVVAAAFAYSRSAILAFKENDIEEANGTRGTLIFTGATASLRGGVFTSAFSAGKHGLRALNQSLAKEFGKENIHVAHVSFLQATLFSCRIVLTLNTNSPSLTEVRHGLLC